MKLAIQHSLLPGETLVEKFQKAKTFGFDGVELVAWGFQNPMWQHAEEIRKAMDDTGMTISSLCSYSLDDFVHPDLEERTKRIQGLVRYLQLADELGASGVIGLPIRKAVRIPDLSPVADEASLITQLAVAALQTALAQTSEAKAAVFLEPLNRYETHYLRTVDHAADLCKQVGSPRVKVMADLFHMSIEEGRIAQSLEAVIGHVGHIHLADSNRLEPGQGHTDFAAIFSILKRADYSGWLALECGLSGDGDDVLPGVVSSIRDSWQRA